MADEPTEEPVHELSDEELLGSHTLAAVVDEINKIDEARMRHEANPNGHPHEHGSATSGASRVPETGLIAQIATRVERLDGQVAAHRVETRAVKVGLASLKDHVDERFNVVDERFDKVDERFDKVDERFNVVNERLNEVDERFDKIDERFDKIVERFEGVDGRFVGVDRRFDGLDSDVQLILDHFGIQRPNDRG